MLSQMLLLYLSSLISHLLNLIIRNASFGHLLALVLSLDIFFLVLVYSFHVLHHLLITRRYHISVLVLHHVIGVVRTHTLHLFSFCACCSFFLLEKCHIQLYLKEKFRFTDKFEIKSKTYLVLCILINAPQILSNTVLCPKVFLGKIHSFLVR